MFTTKTWVLLGVVAAALFFTQRSSAQSISCSSDDGRRHYCPADTRGGVQLAKQRSDSPCNQGYSWGFDRGGIWVDRGCRADFIVNAYQYGGGGGPYPGNSYQGGSPTISCSSDDGGRHYCQADTRGRVRLAQQRSQSPCREGYSWGQDGRGVWVDHGCRADFVVEGGEGGGWNRDRDRYDRDRADPDQIISCSSDDMHRHYCAADARGGVRLLKQRSDSSCRQGYSWGYDRRGIWVDHGCRADFQVIR
ncbi:MAG TPA: DUF3011 domain-containing protein [Terriglobales bacterium]|jgi:hypothetical protein|nr:DUF3011 domain-containing protein [Terriglobales bacterium]